MLDRGTLQSRVAAVDLDGPGIDRAIDSPILRMVRCMGTVFRLIADEVLEPADAGYYTECQACGKPQVPVYLCQGYMACPDGSADKARDVYAACEKCLKQGCIVNIDEYRMDPLIERYAEDPEAEKRSLRMTPRIPLHMQGGDWPLCCGTLTEFVGSPSSLEELVHVQEAGTPWDLGPDNLMQYDARRDGPPESFREVSVFQCFVCDRQHWTFQPT